MESIPTAGHSQLRETTPKATVSPKGVPNRKILIIGAGIAGLCGGVYDVAAMRSRFSNNMIQRAGWR